MRLRFEGHAVIVCPSLGERVFFAYGTTVFGVAAVAAGLQTVGFNQSWISMSGHPAAIAAGALLCSLLCVIGAIRRIELRSDASTSRLVRQKVAGQIRLTRAWTLDVGDDFIAAVDDFGDAVVRLRQAEIADVLISVGTDLRGAEEIARHLRAALGIADPTPHAGPPSTAIS